jgi:hypothetical protein
LRQILARGAADLTSSSGVAPESVAIFCRIVDYFGDAGFCWRLSLALRQMGVARVLLVIDRLNILDELRGSQRADGLEVLPWNVWADIWARDGVPPQHRVDAVVEAFACDPPQAFLQALPDHAAWITLDYLATEPWADGVHGRSSPSPALAHPAARTRRWFVPGFSEATGGLLHGSWRHVDAQQRQRWRARLAGRDVGDDTLLVMGFGYADAPWDALARCLAQRLPEGFSSFALWRPSGLQFSQSEFDEILQSCDLNFVRGEDSFVRAHWASAGPWRVPFLWQPYRQQELAHGHKLAGWMHQIFQHPDLAPMADMHWAWNGLRPALSHQGVHLAAAWVGMVERFPAVRMQQHRACLRFAARRSLESRLLEMLGERSANNPGKHS